MVQKACSQIKRVKLPNDLTAYRENLMYPLDSTIFVLVSFFLAWTLFEVLGDGLVCTSSVSFDLLQQLVAESFIVKMVSSLDCLNQLPFVNDVDSPYKLLVSYLVRIAVVHQETPRVRLFNRVA